GLFESNGFLACWGRNNRGQVGAGTNDDLKEIPNISRIAGLTQWKHVTAGREHSCAVTKQHEAFCWGANQAGQLGSATPRTATAPSPSPPTSTGLSCRQATATPAGSPWAATCNAGVKAAMASSAPASTKTPPNRSRWVSSQPGRM